MTSEADRTLQIIAREEHIKIERHAEERNARVDSAIQARKKVWAEQYRISVEQLEELLKKPQDWLDFTSQKQKTQSGETQINTNKLNTKIRRTQKKSRVTGTIFNTTDWDSFFDPTKRKE